MLCSSSRDRPLFRTRITTCCAHLSRDRPLFRTRIAASCRSLSQAEETWRSFVEHSSTATRILADTPEHDEEGSFQLS